MLSTALGDALSIADLEQMARQTMDPSAYDYCAGGSEDELALEGNIAAFRRTRLRPRVLRPVTTIDLATTVLGQPIACPLVVGPTGLQHLAHPDGEVASARAAARLHVGFCLSTFSSKTPEQVALAAPEGVRWFQLYLLRDRSVTRSLIQRAEAAGYQALVLTVDVPRVGRRERDARNRFKRFMAGRPSLLSDPAFRALLDQPDSDEARFALLDEIFPNPAASWDDVAWVQAQTRLPLVIKGILRADDARAALEAGARAIVVSNHGGRQLGRAPATIDVLPEIAAEVGPSLEVYLDSGVRRGSDVLTALALGARAVFLGRAIVWGLAAGGEAGALRALELLRNELATGLVMLGASRPSELNASFVC